MPIPPRAFFIAFCLAASPAGAEEAMLEVHVQDADVVDWIVIRHAGGCDSVSGRLRIDFGPSDGRVVIDTEFGGGGTLYPRDVEVMNGPVAPQPLEDGARRLDIDVFGLEAGAQAVVTLDIDNERNGPEAGQIVATGADIAGAVAAFTAQGAAEPVQALFDQDGSAYLTVPCVPPGLVMGAAG